MFNKNEFFVTVTKEQDITLRSLALESIVGMIDNLEKLIANYNLKIKRTENSSGKKSENSSFLKLWSCEDNNIETQKDFNEGFNNKLNEEGFIDPITFNNNRSLKKNIKKAIALFNNKPIKGIEFLFDIQYLDSTK